ncbi:MAG: porin family protein [Chitinophagales bacterium]
MNKKTIVAIMVLALSVSSALAKDISEKKNLFGFNVGFGVATVGIKNDSLNAAKNRAKAGAEIGFTFEHRFKKVVALQTGLSYTNKGARERYNKSALVNSGYTQYDFHNLEVPFLVKFYIGKKKIFNLYTGVYAAYAVNVQTRTKIDFVDPFTDIDEKHNNVLNDDNINLKDPDGDRLYLGYDAGVKAGFEFVSKRGFGVGADFSQGFVDFTNPKFNVGSFTENKKAYHTAFNIYAIFKF